MEKQSESVAIENGIDSTPGIKSVHDYMIYSLSLPERALRSTAAMLGGVLTESATLLVPQAFRDSRSYKTFVQQMLEMLANDVGGVSNNSEIDSPSENESSNVENYVARKTVGSFVDLAGMATLHVSPVFVLAIVSDIAYGSKTCLNELSNQLKQEGIIDEDSTIDGASDLLHAISKASGETAAAFDTPPISVDGLKIAIEETRSNFSQIDPTTVLPQTEIDKLWADMKQMAQTQEVGLLELSSAMTMYTLNQVETACKGALTTIRVSGQLVDRIVLNHYWDALEEISNRGVYSVLAESSQPYLEAVWYNFSSERPTVTEDVISGRLAGKVWSGLRGWLNQESGNDDPDT